MPSTNPGRAVALILEAGLAGHYSLLLPPELINEILDKAKTKPYLAARIAPEAAGSFVALLRAGGVALPAHSGPFPALGRDPKDDYLLAYAEAGAADYLVSDDKDLHAIDDSALSFEIVTPAEFLQILRAEGLI